MSIAAAVLAISCSELADPLPSAEDFNGAGNLSIQVTGTIYAFVEEEFSGMRSITAKVTNVSEVDYYALLGDRFNSSLEQETLYIAEGSGGYLESLSGDGRWSSIERGLMTEGVGIIVLKPDHQYLLLFVLPLPVTNPPKGAYRLRIDYSSKKDASANVSFSDYSDAFIIE